MLAPLLEFVRTVIQDTILTLEAYEPDVFQFTYDPARARQLLDEAESKVMEISEIGARSRVGFQAINDVVTQVMERVEELYHRENPSDITGIPTGYGDLDSRTSGLQEGDLVIVAGRPSMGKTAFALNMAEHVAVNEGLPVAVFSMEMASNQLALRMLGSIGRLDQHRLRTGRLTDEDWNKLSNAVGKLHGAQIVACHLRPLRCREFAKIVARKCRALCRRVRDR